MLYNNKFRKSAIKKRKNTSCCAHSNSPTESPFIDEALLQDGSHQWTIVGMDCASCAHKIEHSLQSLPGIERVHVIYSTEKLIVYIKNPTDTVRETIEKRVQALGFDMHYHDPLNPISSSPPLGHHPIPKKDMLQVALLGIMIGLSFILSGFTLELGQYAFIATTLFGLIPILKKTFFLIRSGTPFAIETLMSLSALGALFIGAAEEASMVLFLFGIGEMLEAVAANKAKKGIVSLMSLMPEQTTLVKGKVRQQVSSRSLQPEDIIEVSAGGRLPADVLLLSPMALINESALTGESMPIEYQRGDTIMAGSLVVDNTVQLKVVSKSGQNAVDRILQLIENADERKAPMERFIDRFSRYYTPIIMTIALCVMIIPPLLWNQTWYPWIYKGLTLLLIGCPCALVVSTPASITSALSRAARYGVLIKGGATLEALAHIKYMAFDKTGTLTTGNPAITDILCDSISEKILLKKAAAVEMGSHHPLAKAIIDKAYSYYDNIEEAQERQALAGIGIKGIVEGEEIALITPSKLSMLSLTLNPIWQSRIECLQKEGKTVVMISLNGHIEGLIALQDCVRPEATTAIAQLKQLHIQPLMLTGDNAQSARTLARQLDITYQSELLPIDKLKVIEECTAQNITAMVGDGINDSPAIKAATVGIAMGTASDVALETADAALTKDNLLSLPKLILLSRATTRNIRQNIAFALGIKALFLLTTLLGMTGLWLAVVADSGTTALVTANALRLLRFKSKQV